MMMMTLTMMKMIMIMIIKLLYKDIVVKMIK